MPALLWLGGVLLALYIPPQLVPAGTVAVVAAAAVTVFRPGWRVFVFGACAFLLTGLLARGELASRWHCDERALVLAQIVSVPARTSAGWQFDAELRFEREPQRAHLLARLSWRTDSVSRPRAGETWRLAVQFRAPRRAGSFDGVEPSRGLLRDHIQAEASVLDSHLNERRELAQHSLLVTRAALAERISSQVIDPSAGALLAALAVGVTGDVSRQQWRVFNATGITHLVAISGMHVTFFALISMALARRIWRYAPGLAALIRRERFAAIIGVVLATAYALLSGFSVPAQRTLIMLCAWMLLRESGRCIRPSWSLAIALLAVLGLDPFAALSAGFWLSFAAVASIILLAGAGVRPGGNMREAVTVQGVVSLALLPVTIAIFGTFSFVGLAVNAVAIPVFTFLLVPPILLATLGYLVGGGAAGWCADRLIDVAAWVARSGWPWLARSADPAGALWHAAPTTLWYVLAASAVIIALLPWSRSLRACALLCLASAFAPQSKRPAEAELWVDILDVGAGTSVVLRTRQHTVVFGSSETFGSAGRRFSEQVAPLLQRAGAANADLLVLGRFNRDRAAAMTSARAAFPAVRFKAAAAAEPMPPELGACANSKWQWNGISFELGPSGGANDCSLRVNSPGGNALFMLESDVAIASLLQTRIEEPLSVVLLPRTAAAIPAGWSVGPASLKRFAIASVSRNEWRASTWQRLRENLVREGMEVLSTAEAGALHLRFAAGRPPQLSGQDRLRPGIWTAPDTSVKCGG